MTPTLNGWAELSHLGVIRVTGEEAAKFLQGQLTQDFVLLADGEARLAAFCSAKGRMLATFIGLRQGDEIWLVCSRDILAGVLKRLSMFVLRAKVKLTDATDAFHLRGGAGESMEQLAGEKPVPWSKTQLAGGALVTLYPADEQARGLWIAPSSATPPESVALDPQHWLWSEVRSGVATLTSPVVDAFVPQMLNYESVGGVNFKKGCYPGQEVVARSQFRGTLKRRGYIVRSEDTLSAGQDVFHESDSEQPAGTIAQAAPSPSGGWEAIASLQVAAARGGRLAAGSPDGAALEQVPLPYLLLEDI